MAIVNIYSHTRLATYERCPLSYQYKYIDKIKPEIPYRPIEQFLGECVHISLENLYRHILNSLTDDLALWEIQSEF